MSEADDHRSGALALSRMRLDTQSRKHTDAVSFTRKRRPLVSDLSLQFQGDERDVAGTPLQFAQVCSQENDPVQWGKWTDLCRACLNSVCVIFFVQSEPFIHPVDEKQFPEYRSYIIQPMTLTMLEKNIKENAYGSTQAFEADAKWILHNSIIFNSC
jgi:uncharacterized protein YjdB